MKSILWGFVEQKRAKTLEVIIVSFSAGVFIESSTLRLYIEIATTAKNGSFTPYIFCYNNDRAVSYHHNLQEKSVKNQWYYHHTIPYPKIYCMLFFWGGYLVDVTDL
jgi:hypothetical protein